MIARALYDFTPQREDELAFKAGDEMVVCVCMFEVYTPQVLAPRQLQSGWVLAGKDKRSGYVVLQLGGMVTNGYGV